MFLENSKSALELSKQGLSIERVHARFLLSCNQCPLSGHNSLSLSNVPSGLTEFAFKSHSGIAFL